MISSSEREKYYTNNKDVFEDLKVSLKPNLSKDLERYKEEIIEVLENEIIARYFYQKGRVEASLKKDPYILKAVSVFNDLDLYNKILNPSE